MGSSGKPLRQVDMIAETVVEPLPKQQKDVLEAYNQPVEVEEGLLLSDSDEGWEIDYLLSKKTMSKPVGGKETRDGTAI